VMEGKGDSEMIDGNWLHSKTGAEASVWQLSVPTK